MGAKRREKPGMLRRFVRGIYTSIANYAGVPYGSGYNAIDPTRKLIERYGQEMAYSRTTANELLNGALGPLRTYCRGLERNNATARAGIEALVALVVGSGIALEPETDNERFKEEWRKFCASCGTDGSSIYDLQRRAFRDIPAAGEAVWRFVASDLGSDIPVQILALESEWIVDQLAENEAISEGITIANGIELDALGNPTAYWLQRPDGNEAAERVGADSIVHMFEHRRSLQARGEPWFAPLIETLINERQLVDVELYAAKMSAAMALIVKSSDDGVEFETDGYGDPVASISPGTVARIDGDEEVEAFSHTRPSQQIAPFRQMLRGDIAACLRVPVRALDRDVSRANYSSMRADMLDEAALLYPVRDWFGHQSIGRVFREVAPMIAARLGMEKVPTEYRLLPDGQPYVDPLKDAQAADFRVARGYTTKDAEISARGGDPAKVREARNAERVQEAADAIAVAKAAQELANKANAETPGLGINWSQIATMQGADTSPASYLSSLTGSQESQGATAESEATP